jgi:uncharacterized membrane protein YraQ (UPF0718 family)
MTLLRRTDDRRLLRGSLVLVVVAVVGLYVVKWNPYFYKAIDAASSHSLGEPITGEDAPAPSVGAALGYASAYFLAVWKAMVLGLLIGSGVQVLLPREWLAKALGKAGLGSSTAAAALAVPSMMCTCCATPVAVGLKRCKASTGAAVAYLVGNPMLNPATIVFMGFVLGWGWSVLRVATALPLVFGAAYLSDRLAPGEADVVRTAEVRGAERLEVEQEGSPFVRWAKVLLRMVVLLVPEYLVVVLLVGAAQAFVFPHLEFSSLGAGGGILLALWLAVAGTLFVIPTAGEIPIVQTLTAAGLGPLGAGVLFTTPPAISLPSLVMAGWAFPKRVLASLALLVALMGLVTGLVALAFGLS